MIERREIKYEENENERLGTINKDARAVFHFLFFFLSLG